MFEELLSRIDTALTERDLPYMIIGGQAVLLYGEPRLTRDIDVTLGIGPDRVKTVIEVAIALDFTVLPEEPEVFVKQSMVLPVLDKVSGIRVDFIFSVTPYEKEAISRARFVSLGGRDVAFASAEDLIIHKIFAGRPKDLEDVRSVMLKNRSIDIKYVEDWLERFDEGDEITSYMETLKEIIEDIQ